MKHQPTRTRRAARLVWILPALALACSEAPVPPAPEATPAPTAQVMAVEAACELLDAPGGVALGVVEPGAPLATGARRADDAGVVWMEVSTPDGRRGWLPESRLVPAGEEGRIATH